MSAETAKKTGRDAFTLIELLVVISILAILIAILIPALQGARQVVRQVVCAAQMKQWSLAVVAYATANDDYIPVYANTCDPTGNAENPETYWYFRLVPYLNDTADVVSASKWGFYKMRRCPSGKANWGSKAVWIGVYYDKHKSKYAPFFFLNNSSTGTLIEISSPIKTTRIKRPSEYLMLMDVKRDRIFNPFHWPWTVDFDGDGIYDDRHEGIDFVGQDVLYIQALVLAVTSGKVIWASDR